MLYADGAFKLANPLVSPLADSYTLLEKRASYDGTAFYLYNGCVK
jgi:hypothetical protein